MITPEILAIVMFLTTLGLLLFGFPVAFTLAGSALLFGFLGFLDDMKKIREQDPKGLSSYQKITIQILFSTIIIYLISSQRFSFSEK